MNAPAAWTRKGGRSRFRLHRPLVSSSSPGFSLIELLVAVAVIAVLAALLVPWIKTTISSAKGAECLGKLKNLGVGAHAYIGDNNGLLPLGVDTGVANGYNNQNWMYNLGPYLGIAVQKNIGNEPFTTVFLCPQDPSRNPRQLRTYRYAKSYPSPQSLAQGEYPRGNYVPTRNVEIVRPSTFAMIMCVAYTGPRPLEIWKFDEAFYDEPTDRQNPSDLPSPHYGGKARNILYADGHAAKASLPLAPETWHFDGK